jgi:hypothetical protein
MMIAVEVPQAAAKLMEGLQQREEGLNRPVPGSWKQPVAHLLLCSQQGSALVAMHIVVQEAQQALQACEGAFTRDMAVVKRMLKQLSRWLAQCESMPLGQHNDVLMSQLMELLAGQLCLPAARLAHSGAAGRKWAGASGAPEHAAVHAAPAAVPWL